MKRTLIKTITLLTVSSVLAGCMGQMGTSQLVTKANLTAVDNRYGRAGLFVLLSPVYGIAGIADLFIFNSIEFWTGTNPITGKSPAVVDMPIDSIFKINNRIDTSMHQPPLASMPASDIQQAQLHLLDAKTMEMDVTYLSGEKVILRGEKFGNDVNFYLHGVLIAAVSVDELKQYTYVNKA